jgi:hypothetical protein
MDGQSFDRIARLLGGAASRRAGIKAAVVAAVGLATRGVLPEQPVAAKPTQDGPCDDRSGKMNRCKADGDCCTRYCKTGKSGKTGRCRCIHRGKPCRPEQKCCNGTCTNGKCPRKKRRCVKAGKSCKTKTKTTKKGKKKRIKQACCSGKCTNGKCPKTCKADGASCTAASECCGGACTSGICAVCTATGQACTASPECCSGLCDANVCKEKIATSVACVAGDVCQDPLAECTSYQSSQPAGTYCLLAQSESTCEKNNDCITQICTSGTCEAYQPGLAGVCGASSATDTCTASSNATCQTYASSWQNSNGDQYFCTLDTGETCPVDVGDCACKSSACNGGTCCDTGSGLQPDNTTCDSNSDCCSNLCRTMGTTDQEKYCISTNQVWAVVNYNGSGEEINLWAISTQDIPYAYGMNYNSSDDSWGSNKPFMTSGGVVNWYNQWRVPMHREISLPTGPGNKNYPNGDGDAYCRDASGNPYTAVISYLAAGTTASQQGIVFANTKPGYKYRVLANWDAQCSGDSYSVDACGPSWSGLETTGIWQTNAVFKFFKGNTQAGSSITVPANPGGANPLRKYWWWVADVIYDGSNQPTVNVVNTLHECMPIPYALDGGPVSGGLRQKDYVLGEAGGGGYSNWCTPIPWVTGS